ncbi:MAG: hypothetical protein DMF84_07395 [Acidobacteria bacterium]|nr:MAG: hypothetical protein DMF84_07395 [Acidobacteriota bacterium]
MRRIARSFLLLFVTIPLHATVLLPIEFRELVTIAPVIVHGQVVDVHSEWVDGRRSVETFVTVEAAEYLKGNLGEQFTFKVPGGQLGRYRTVFVGAPIFQVGDEVVLFLKSTGSSFPFIIGLSQGVFRVVTDTQSGRRVVTPPAVMSVGGADPARVVRGDPARKTVSIEVFRDVVRQVLSEGAAR